MKKTSFALAVLLQSTVLFANEHGKGLGAHEHGSIKLDLAASEKTLEIDLDGPAESFLGFEYLAKTVKDKKTFEDAKTLWTKDLLTKLFVLDKKLGCKVTEVKFEQVVDSDEDHKDEHGKKEAGVHSDIEATAKIVCAQNLMNQSLSVAVKKNFPHIKKLTIDLVATETKTFDAKAVEILKL
ncbi:MAG: DUF2796 domain-containing protein [Bdellovibrionales bacterium]|nr:DUF2796 domain-containing protein [Bdellovibrionales bacterium]